MNADRAKSGFPPAAVARNFKELQHDVLVLLRLQVDLVRMDIEQWRRRLSVPLFLLVLAVALALGSVPVLLYGVAQALTSLSGMPLALSLEIVAVVSLGIAAIAAYYGWQRLQAANVVFQRSEEELKRNIEWLKELLSDKEPTTTGQSFNEASSRGANGRH
ncbi:MAG: phage holin family protein [Planctomycetia bacterium]|nr:phage holin family protein [Planctomycetia bacterium]